MKLKSLEELRALVPESERKKRSDSVSIPEGMHDGKGRTVRILLDTKGRKGNRVTVVEGLLHNPQTLEGIAKTLKQYCGAGGTVKGGVIEIQGDQRKRITAKLRSMNYMVK